MNFLNILGYRPNELDESEFREIEYEHDLTECLFCGCYHKDGDFCSDQCEAQYKKEVAENNREDEYDNRRDMELENDY